MRDAPEPPIFGPEYTGSVHSDHPQITRSRSLAKAISWRAIGSLDTFILSYVLITFLGPLFGMEHGHKEAIGAAGYIAVTEVATKMVLYYAHERCWEWNRWGVSLVGLRRKESYARTTTKTATWRMFASLDTMLLAYFFTGNIATAVSIGGFEVFTKLVLYFFHERAWAHIRFGIVSGVEDLQPGSEPPEPAGA